MTEKHTNSSSNRTRRLIREEFARLLQERKSIAKISVTELVTGAGISRSTFYTHYNSISDVAADIKNETLRVFFDHKRIRDPESAEAIIDSIYRYLKKNDRIFKMMFESPEATEFALELGRVARQQIIEQIHRNHQLKDQYLFDLEVSMLTDGLALLCVRYYRGELDTSLEDIIECAKIAGQNLIRRRGEIAS